MLVKKYKENINLVSPEVDDSFKSVKEMKNHLKPAMKG